MLQTRERLNGRHCHWLRRLIDVGVVLGLALAAGIGLYALTSPWPDTPDGLFHLQRVRALAEALRWGVLYPRWFPDFSFGYGYPVLNFYAPAFYYPPALLHVLGLDVLTATRVALALFFALSGIAAYALLRQWTRVGPAFVGAVLFLVYPYRLYDLFVRGALPEFAAFLWLPVTAAATWRLVRSTHPSPIDLALAAGAWAGLLLTHNLTSLMWMPVIALAVILLRRVRPLLTVGRAMGVGGLLAAFYVVPVLGEMGWVGIGAVPGGEGYARHFVALSNLFTWTYVFPYPPASEPTVPVPGYVLVIMILGGLVALGGHWADTRRIAPLPNPDEKGEPRGAMPHLLFVSLLVLALSLWLTTDTSAWVWKWIAPLRTLQFPWRWHTVAALALAAVFALSLDILLPYIRWTTVLLYGGLAVYVTLYAVAGLPTAITPMSEVEVTPERMWALDREHGQVGASWTAEFLPRWVTEQRWAIGHPPTRPEPILPRGVRNLALSGVGYLSLRGTFEATRDAFLLFHRFYYPAWEVRVDGKPVATEPVTSLGVLAARVPRGSHTFLLQWKPTPAVWVGRALTAVGWVLVLAWLARGVRSRWRRWGLLILWGAVGALLVAGALGVLEREVRPRPVGADYGPLVLSAARWEEDHEMGGVRVHTYWFIRQRPEPVTAFVHLVDGQGRVVAQYDGPIGGGYTPIERWQPGLLLEDTRLIALPPSLPPGTYRLLAGLYRPGFADQPLVPRGGRMSDPRVEIGVIEVAP